MRIEENIFALRMISIEIPERLIITCHQQMKLYERMKRKMKKKKIVSAIFFLFSPKAQHDLSRAITTSGRIHRLTTKNYKTLASVVSYINDQQLHRLQELATEISVFLFRSN
jgi:hypothetical protein